MLTCVKIIAETFACLPVSLKQIKNGRIQTVNEHPIAQLLRRKVNPYTTAYEWKQWIAIDYLTANFGFSLLSRNGSNGEISGIWQQNAKDVKAFRNEENYELYYGVALDSLGESVDFKYTEAFRFINFNNSGILGNNITELARNTLRAVNATTKFARDFYEQGIFPDGFIEWSAEIQDENTSEAAREVLKNDLREKYAGTGKFHQALLLPSGAKWIQVQNDLQKLQAVETRKFNRQIVASMFRVSPFLMGESGGDWEGQIKNMLPMIVNFESAAAMCLLSEEEQREGYFFKMNVDALERGNLSTYTSALSTAVNNGLMTDNEAREKIDLPPVEGGDELRVNSALQSPAHSKNAGGQNEYSEGKENV